MLLNMAAPDSRSSTSLRSPRPSKIARHMTDERSVRVNRQVQTKRKNTVFGVLSFCEEAIKKIFLLFFVWV